MPEISSRHRLHYRHDAHRRRTSNYNTNSNEARTPTIPTYQPPLYPLNAGGKHALSTLLQKHSQRRLLHHLQHVSEKLTDSAGEVNERLTDARARYERKKSRRNDSENNDGGHEGNNEEYGSGDVELNQLAQMEERVKDVTGKLEESIRAAIDAEVRVGGLGAIVAEIAREEGPQGEDEGLSRGSRRGRRRPITRSGAGGEEDEDEDEDDDGQTQQEEQEPDPPSNPPSRKLDEKLTKSYDEWARLSLTQRYVYIKAKQSHRHINQNRIKTLMLTCVQSSYSTHNTYIGFYRIVHEAKHPSNDIPPLPHASTWFSHLEQPKNNNSSSTPETDSHQQDRAASNSDDDIAIERERISLKCPLTLLPFKDPVTSTKCPHSFEKHAIEDMIRRSPMMVPAPNPGAGHQTHGRENRKRVRAVKCPVCTVVLTMDDFRADVALLRRVRRAEAAMQREEVEEELDVAGGKRRRSKGGRKSGITVASDDEDEDDSEEVDDESDDDESRDGRAIKRQLVNTVHIKSERAMTEDPMAIDDE